MNPSRPSFTGGKTLILLNEKEKDRINLDKYKCFQTSAVEST